MKRFSVYLSLLVVIAISAMTFTPAKADQPPPKALDYIDAQLNVFLPILADFQANYIATNGSYFQALQSHDSPPDGVAPADNLNSAPTDQAVALATLWEYADLPEKIGWAYRVDVYNGPSGPGYVVTMQVLVKGDIWIKSVNYGPDTWRAADWYKYVESQI